MTIHSSRGPLCLTFAHLISKISLLIQRRKTHDTDLTSNRRFMVSFTALCCHYPPLLALITLTGVMASIPLRQRVWDLCHLWVSAGRKSLNYKDSVWPKAHVSRERVKLCSRSIKAVWVVHTHRSQNANARTAKVNSDVAHVTRTAWQQLGVMLNWLCFRVRTGITT